MAGPSLLSVLTAQDDEPSPSVSNLAAKPMKATAGGFCVVPGECKCKDGYEGADCSEEVDLCQSDPCQNGATCTTLLADYICSCPTGFSGDNCESPIPTEPTVATTSEEQSTGEDGQSEAGKYLEIAVAVPVVVVLVAMAAVVLFLVIVCVMKRSRQKLTDTQNIMMKQNEVYEVRPSPAAAVNDTTEKVALQDNPGYGVTPANPIELQDNPGYGVTPANPIELQDNPGYGVNSPQSYLHGKTLDNEYDYI